MQNLPAETPITQQGVDVFKTRKTPVAILFPFEYGAEVSDNIIGCIGVLDELRVARV